MVKLVEKLELVVSGGEFVGFVLGGVVMWSFDFCF